MSVSALKKAFADGAHAKRGGVRREFANEVFDKNGKWTQPIGTLQVAWIAGWDQQSANPGQRVVADDFSLCFDMVALKGGLLRRTHAPLEEKEMNMPTRTKKQLDELRTKYRTETYDAYAEQARANNQEPQDFEEAFSAHLTALDAAEPTPAAQPAKPKGAKPKAAPKPKAAKPVKERGPRGYRATSEDRKLINAAAEQVGKRAKVESKVRCLPQDGQTYSDFLSGRVLKIDADGNGSTTLDVVPTKDSKSVGTILVTVSGGKLSAKPTK